MIKLTDLRPGPLACFFLHGDFAPLPGQVVINSGLVMAVSATGIGPVCLAQVWDVAHPESQPSSAHSKALPSSFSNTRIHTNTGNVSEDTCETSNLARSLVDFYFLFPPLFELSRGGNAYININDPLTSPTDTILCASSKPEHEQLFLRQLRKRNNYKCQQILETQTGGCLVGDAQT